MDSRVDWNSIQHGLIYGKDWAPLKALKDLNNGLEHVDNAQEFLKFSRLNVWISRYLVIETGCLEEQRQECLAIIRTLLERRVMTDIILQGLLAIMECPEDNCWTGALELICKWTTIATEKELNQRIWKGLIQAALLVSEPLATIVHYVILNGLENPNLRDHIPMNMLFATLIEPEQSLESIKSQTTSKTARLVEFKDSPSSLGCQDLTLVEQRYLRAINFWACLMRHLEGLIYLYSREVETMRFAMRSLLVRSCPVKVLKRDKEILWFRLLMVHQTQP